MRTMAVLLRAASTGDEKVKWRGWHRSNGGLVVVAVESNRPCVTKRSVRQSPFDSLWGGQKKS